MSKLFFSLIPVAAACLFLTPAPALAGHDNPFYEAAECYREAAIDFEKEVDNSRFSERDQRRAADRLEDLTSDLRRAAKRPERTHQLLHEWHTIQRQFAAVEAIVFRDPRCPLGAEVWPCWQRVVRAHYAFGRLVASLSHHRPACHHRSPLDGCPSCQASTRHHVQRPPLWNATPTAPRFNTAPVVPRYNSPERFREHYGQPRSQVGRSFSLPGQSGTGNLRHYRSRSNQWSPTPQVSPQQSFRPDRQPLYQSPTQRQLESNRSNLRRSETFRKLNNAASIGALISRLVD